MMERKTMGSLIAALRKASGMTQKELAERLNVSDKSVSRWERDDGAPDLSLIPVIAEVFGITCDELLRGQRRSPEERMEAAEAASSEPDQPSPRADKQRQRILALSLTRYKNRTMIAMGLTLVGVIAAMIGNLAFLRAYLGFFLGVAFYVASAVCQVVFINQARLAVDDEDMAGVDTGAFRKTVIHLAEVVFSLNGVQLGATLPLLGLVTDAYRGLSAESWLLYGVIFGLIAMLVCGVVCYFLNDRLLKRGAYTLSEAEEAAYRHNFLLKKRCAKVLAAMVAVTAITQGVVNIWDAAALADKTVFKDINGFVDFMAQDMDYGHASFTVVPFQSVASNEPEVVYRDAQGNPITHEEALENLLRRELRVSDGTEEGRLICTYIHRNESVSRIEPNSKSDDGLPITVITSSGLRMGYERVRLIHFAFVAIYLVEIIAAFLLYWKKRQHHTHRR